MKKVIGVTGGVGSGKSRVLNFLRDEYGADIIVADRVAEELEDIGGSAIKPLTDAFGEVILDEEGRLDRAAFSDLIFSDQAALDKVNAIVHPLTIDEISRRIDRSSSPLTVVEAAVFPDGLKDLCDEIWFVDADEDIRKERLISDRGYSPEKCEDIMNSQASREGFLSFSNKVIDNNGPLEETQRQITSFLTSTGESRK